MEETFTKIAVAVDELHHYDVSLNQIVSKDTKNVAAATEEIIENPEYIVMRRSTALQTVTNEEVAIPKRDLVLNQRSNLTEVGSEGGSTMDIDISSQESMMDIASQESLSAKHLNSGDLDHKVSASSHEEMIPKEESARKRCSHAPGVPDLLHESLLMEEEALRKLEEARLEFREGLRVLKKAAVNRKKVMLQLKMDARELQEMLHNQEAQLADQEVMLKKLETERKILELEALGYEVVPLSIESNGCLPPKRSRRD